MDYNSSLPIRTENDGDVKNIMVDATTPSQGAKVDANGKQYVLAYGNDGTNDVVMPIDPTSGAVQVDIVDASGITVDVDVEQYPDNEIVGAAKKGNLALGTDGTNYQVLSVDSAGILNVKTQDPVQVSADGSANTALNPIFVSDVAGASLVDDIQDFETTASVAVSATHTTTYTVTVGKTLKLKQCRGSGSGKIKVEVKVGPVASEVLKAVAFNSTSNPNAVIEFPTPIEVAATENVLVIVTNRDLQVQDLYADINGEEL